MHISLWTFISGSFCNYTWDTYLCWPPTPSNTIVKQPCPPHSGLNVTSKCELNGKIAYVNLWTVQLLQQQLGNLHQFSSERTSERNKAIQIQIFNSTSLKPAYQCVILLCASFICLNKTIWRKKWKDFLIFLMLASTQKEADNTKKKHQILTYGDVCFDTKWALQSAFSTVPYILSVVYSLLKSNKNKESISLLASYIYIRWYECMQQ